MCVYIQIYVCVCVCICVLICVHMCVHMRAYVYKEARPRRLYKRLRQGRDKTFV